MQSDFDLICLLIFYCSLSLLTEFPNGNVDKLLRKNWNLFSFLFSWAFVLLLLLVGTWKRTGWKTYYFWIRLLLFIIFRFRRKQRNVMLKRRFLTLFFFAISVILKKSFEKKITKEKSNRCCKCFARISIFKISQKNNRTFDFMFFFLSTFFYSAKQRHRQHSLQVRFDNDSI